MILNCHSQYSLRYGIFKLEDIIAFAEQQDHRYLGLTEINSSTTLHDFLRLTKGKEIHPIWGIDFRNGAAPCFVAYATHFEGVLELNTFLSTHLEQKLPIPDKAPNWKHCTVVYPFSKFKKNIFQLNENEYLGVPAHELPIFERTDWTNQRNKTLAYATSTFTQQKHINMHQLLRCIENNILLSKLTHEMQGNPKDLFISKNQWEHAFEGYEDLQNNTLELAKKLVWNAPDHFHTSKNLTFYTGNLEGDKKLLRSLAYEGIAYRYKTEPNDDSVVIKRLEKELEVIEEKNFLSYFLINWDITQYARSKGYYYIGRGSGANSLVAYLLRITDVDPIELDLYFERFINLYRQNPPDFDIDFSWTDREDITQYIFKRFENVALLGAYNTFQYKAVVRELGKVFGLPKEEIDMLCDGKFNTEQLDRNQTNVLRYASYIQEFPNSLAIHSAGILIANEPIHTYSATHLPPKGFPTVMFDMVVAEDIGLHKFDILSQRGLAKIKEAIELVEINYPDIHLDLHDITPLKVDERIKQLLRTANAIGCFYVESPAMRMLLTKLQVDDYLGLVAASSVIRPGVSSSGMMKEYILRHRDKEHRQRAHPELLQIMPETYGVMVYQEDVIKVAHFFGGLSLAEADVLRRGMSGKFRGREEFDRARNSFFEKAQSRGNSFEDVREIWRQIESFAGYAFAKGHSASYAVESYQSLFLKAYFPLEYMTATVNHFGGFYDTEIYLIEAKKHGAVLSPPCVFQSENKTVLLGNEIILGFGLVKALEAETIARLLHLRETEGLFSISQLMDQAHISIEQMSILIRVGALRKFNKSKKQLLWEVHFHGNPAPKTSGPSLFREPDVDLTLPDLSDDWIETAYDQIELLDFPLCSPFELAGIEKTNVTAHNLHERIGKYIEIWGYLVNTKRTKTSKGEMMYFGTFLDAEMNFFDTVHFPIHMKKAAFKGRGIYKICGVVSEEFGAYNIDATSAEKLPYLKDPRYT